MPGLDLRGQNLLLKRMFWLIPLLLVAFLEWDWSALVVGRGYRSALGGAFFIFIVGFAVLAIAVGVGVPRIWMRVSDRDRQMLLTGSLIANVIGWTSMAILLARLLLG